MSHGFNAHFVILMCQLRLRRRIPWVCSYHGLYHAPSATKRVVGSLYNRFTEYVLRRHVIGVVAVADHCRRHLVKRGVPAEAVEVIHNGIKDRPPADMSIRKAKRFQWGLKEEDFVVGVASRLDPVKGIGYLLAGLPALVAQFPHLKAVVLGDGSEEEALRQEAEDLGLGDCVRFLGRQSDVPDAMSAFDIFALPSLAEYHSIALLEAMRAGLPIVATTVGGNPESIDHGKEGLMVAPKEPAAMASAIERLINEPGLALRLGKAARQRFLSQFTEEVTLRKTSQWLVSCARKAQKDRRFSWLRRAETPFCPPVLE